MASPVSAGSATITAAMVVSQPIAGTISGSTTFTVTPEALTTIIVTPANPSITLGDVLQFTATGTYTNNSIADLTGFVTWSSANTSIAVVGNIGANGKATSIAAGSTTITAALGGIAGSTTLTVTPASPPDPVSTLPIAQVATAL
jgi:hypothetical protein